jgi:outer membrane protein TolC
LNAARREVDAAALERRATEQLLRAELASAVERVRSAAAAYDTLRLRVVPGREQLVEELLQSYRSGRSSYLDLAAEQRNLVDAELALVDAQADLWRAGAQLAFLTGFDALVPKEDR